MSDEASRETCRQIVFLIDSNPSFWGSNYCAKDTANAIRLCVLRVLTYFSDYGSGKRSNLRWGYKFFNSRSLSHQFERHEFKEFSVDVFEEFENQVSKRLNESFAQVNVLTQNELDGEECSTFSKPPAGAKCISCAFTNTVHDFQWERPDISSPVRRTRGNENSLHGNRTKIRNVMILLSGCPCDDGSISDFTGEKSSSLTTLDGVKNILMPSVLYNEFKERRICLQWVNIGNVQQEKNTSLKTLLDGFVEQLGGRLMPLSAVIYTGNIFSEGSGVTSGSGTDVTSCSSHGALFPFKTVMDFYFCGKMTKLSEVVNITQQYFEKELGCSETTGLLCSSGTDDKVHCSVRLHSMFQPVAGLQGSRDCHHSTVTEPADITAKASTSTEYRSSPNPLWIRGVINHACVCPTWLHPTKGYSCIGMDGRHTVDSTNSALCSQGFISGWFQELLLSLAKENKLLVLDFIDCDSGLPVSGVLQPLTSVCGVINVIASDYLVTFEKLLLWNGKTSVLDRKNMESLETSQHLVHEHRSKTVSKPAESLRYNEVFLRLTGSQNNLQDLTTTDAREFEAGFVDPWCSFPVVDNNRSLWSELTRGNESEEEEEDDDDSEVTLMKELKNLYNSKETKSTSTVVNGTQSPKQLKRKLNTPTKSKVKKDALKLSGRNVDKETKNDDENSKLGENESQPAVEKNIKIIEDTCTTEDKLTPNSTGTQGIPCDIQDEAQLVKDIHDLCDKIILEGASIEITNIVTLISMFYNGDNGRQKDCVSQFLGENVLLSISTLREKYEGCNDVIRTGQQVRDYQLQILLRMEMSVLTNADEKSSLVEEVTILLRAISFMKDPKFLSVYLHEILLQRYSRSLPKFLCGVYEGLMMRPPRDVLTPSKWSSDDESPVRRSVNSNSSAKQDSSQPRSSGCRILTRHLSVADVGKRREIVVPGKAKPKDKEKKKKEKPHGSNNSRVVNKKEEKKTRGQKTPVKLVRRNLFTESEEGDENSSTARVPRKRKLSEGGKNEQARRQFHRRNTVGSFSKSAVQETPAHKQVSHALWCKQDRARKRSSAYTAEVPVLQESPLKELQAGEGLPRRSPRRHPAVIFQRSQSFYGRSASAGPLTRTRSFTGTYSCDSPKKEPTEGSGSIPCKETVVKKTPQKMSSAALSPLRFSPRHKKKFSLHSLLNTAKGFDQKEDSLPSGQRPTTPKEKLIATRSSPRLLKQRSFSCIGFSSVPFPGVQKEKLDPLRAKPRSFENTSRQSPVEEEVCSDDVLHEDLMKTQKKENAEKLSDVGVITPKSTIAQSQKRTPLKDYQIDECVVLITPIRNPLKSPVQVSPKVIAADPSSDHAQPRVIDSSKHFYESAGVSDTNTGTPVKKVVSPPAVRSSPRLLSKWDIPESSKVTLSETLCQSTSKDVKIAKPSSVVSPKSSRDDLRKPRTPVKDHHLDDFVVLLTPIRRPITSPVHLRSQHNNAIVTCSDSESTIQLNGRNISTATEGTERIADLHGDVKLPCSTHASPTAAQLLWNQRPQNSTPPPKKGKKKSCVVSNSPAEIKRLSPLNRILRQQKRKRCLSSSPADKRCREAIEVHARNASPCARRTPNKKTSMRSKGDEELSLLNVSCPTVIEDNNSRSSEDADDWLKEMEKEYDRSVADKNEVEKSPPTKKRRIHKSVVFGGKRARKETSKKQKNKSANSSLSSDTSYEDDDEVFQSPAVLASSLRRRHLNKTPLSASSIKVLQESPILLDSKLSISPSARTRSCSDVTVSPNSEDHSRKGRLTRRKFVDISSHREAGISAYVDDQEQPIGFHLRKRLKLTT